MTQFHRGFRVPTLVITFGIGLVLMFCPATAQVTYVNTFVAGGDSVGGNLPYPIVVSAGPAGQVVVSDSLNSLSKAYAVDGTYQFSLLPDSATGFGPAHTTYSTVGPDGHYYLSAQAIPSLYSFDATGTGLAQINLADASSRTGYALAPTGTFFVATSTAATGNTPAAAQVSLYSSTGTLLTRFGEDHLDRISLRGLALSPDVSRVYVADNGAIMEFTPSGAYVGAFGNTAGPGQLNVPNLISVAQTGLVYVVDNQPGVKVYSADGVYQRTVIDTVNGATFTLSGLSVGPTGFIYGAGLRSGIPIAARFFDPAAWSYGLNSFTNPSAGPTSVSVGAGGLLGQTLTLSAPFGKPAMQLNVGGTLTVENGNLTIAGGGVTAGTLTVDASTGPANFALTAGTLAAANIAISSGGVASISQVAVTTTSLRVADAASRLSVDQNASLTVESLANKGQIYVGAGASLIAYSLAAGEDGSGTFNLGGGTLDLRFAASLGSAGIVQGSGALSTTMGFSNGGKVKLSGPSSVRGAFTNQPGATVEVSGLLPTIFFDSVVNNGQFTVKAGAAAVFENGFSGSGAPSAALSVAGTAQFQGAATVAALTVAGSVAAPTGTVDLASHALVITASVDGASTGGGTVALANVRKLVIAGNQRGNVGPGVVSSAALADSRLEVGYARAGDLFGGHGGTFLGQSVNADDLLLRTTLAGDANLDGSVDFNDLVALAQNYNTNVSLASEDWWSRGDATYDGVVDFNDLVKLAQNYNTALEPSAVPGASAVFEADLARAFASVPEPSAEGFILLAVGGWGIRRRGNRRVTA
jgi:hypothetical protein